MNEQVSADAAFPALTLVLPGTWVQVPVRDQERVDRLLDQVALADGTRRADGWRTHLDRLRQLGGDQVLVSTSEPASVLVTSWPEASARTADELVALADGTDCVALPHRDDWPLVKLRGATGEGTSAAYFLAHPRTGRVLTLEVSVDVPDFEHLRWRTLDALVGELEWDASEHEEAPGAARR